MQTRELFTPHFSLISARGIISCQLPLHASKIILRFKRSWQIFKLSLSLKNANFTSSFRILFLHVESHPVPRFRKHPIYIYRDELAESSAVCIVSFARHSFRRGKVTLALVYRYVFGRGNGNRLPSKAGINVNEWKGNAEGIFELGSHHQGSASPFSFSHGFIRWLHAVSIGRYWGYIALIRVSRAEIRIFPADLIDRRYSLLFSILIVDISQEKPAANIYFSKLGKIFLTSDILILTLKERKTAGEVILNGDASFLDFIFLSVYVEYIRHEKMEFFCLIYLLFIVKFR